jgi:hypothetical protein
LFKIFETKDGPCPLSKFVYLFEFYFKPTQYRSYGDVPALLVEEDLTAFPCIISGTNGHLRRTTDIL